MANQVDCTRQNAVGQSHQKHRNLLNLSWSNRGNLWKQEYFESFLAKEEASTKQVEWVRKNTVGHSFYIDSNPIDQPDGQKVYSGGKRIDHTEAFGAFDSILKSYSLGTRSLDIGGGEEDLNAAYLSERYQIKQSVIDPFKRSKEHNLAVLSDAIARPFDTVTSISVLNVISSEEALNAHIHLTKKCVKEGGKVFFKVWPNNGSGIPSNLPEEGWQSNRRLASYLEIINKVFGKNVILDTENQLIYAVK